MSNKKSGFLFYFFLVITFTSCQKQLEVESLNVEKGRIIDFIKASVTESTTFPIAEISLALKEAKLQFEDSENGQEKFIVAKLNHSLSIINEENESNLYLIGFYDLNEKIRKVKFVSYFDPKLGVTRDLPRNTLNKVVNIGTNDVDGLFKFYSIEGKFQFSLNYTNGTLNAAGHMVKFPRNGNLVQAVNKASNSVGQKSSWLYECSDVYLVTTYYDTDGNYMYETREFSFTQGNCTGAGSNEHLPVPEPGGGSGNPEEYEYARLKIKQWQIGNLPDHLPTNSDRAVLSWENIRGKKVSSEPQGGHFTSITHNSDECRCGNLVWYATEVTVAASLQTATAKVKGGVSWAGTYYTLENNTSWSFSQIFP